MPALLVEVYRGEVVESRHYGHIAVVGQDHAVVRAVGSVETVAFMRSVAKPLQALPVLESGAAQRFGLSDAELACMAGSLNGQDFQVQAVRSILDKIGLSEEHLLCGVHKPSHRASARTLEEKGLPARPVHNNCAGKHAALLALCVHHGWPVETYLEASHPAQQLILETIARVSEIPQAEIRLGIDGCGVPVFALPLKNIALAYAKLAASDAEAMKRLMKAMLAYPEMIAGDERICTEIMRAVPGKVLAKTGAEGTYALSLVESGQGVAICVEDGAPRAVHAVVIEVLKQLQVLPEETLSSLKHWHRPEVRNHRKEVVGRVSPAFKL